MSVHGREFAPQTGVVQATSAEQFPRSFRSGQGVLAPQRHREVNEADSTGGGLDVDDGHLGDEIGPHGGTVAVEKREPGVPRHGTATTDMIDAPQQATLRTAPFEVHSACALLTRQRREEPLGLVGEAPEVAVVLVRGQRVLLPLAILL